MNESLKKLLSIATPQLKRNPLNKLQAYNSQDESLIGELNELLSCKNGCYAFESALHIFPAEDENPKNNVMTVEVWNDLGTWIGEYEYRYKSERFLCFAEDIFGCQFCIYDGAVCIFDPETGDMDELATNLEEWASNILNDYHNLTGYPVANQWQREKGELPQGKRLLPKVPFIGGGAYSIENLYTCNSVLGMRIRSSIARQINDLPEGAQFTFKIG